MTPFNSENGPSVTVSLPLAALIRAPRALGRGTPVIAAAPPCQNTLLLHITFQCTGLFSNFAFSRDLLENRAIAQGGLRKPAKKDCPSFLEIHGIN